MDDHRRKIGKITAFVLACTTTPLFGQTLNVVAQSAAVVDSYSGDFLFAKNENAKQYPASSTKILTALIVIESGDLDHLVTVDLADTKVEPSSLGLKPGEQYTRRQLLFGLLLKSANDVAMALARDNAGSVSAFAEKMNLRAAQLGATFSHFANPHGLHDPNHYTTAHDLVLIGRAAMQQPLFREIVSTVYYTWRAPSGQIDQLRNHNRLLRHFAGCNGLKTGYTRIAQQVLVSSALRGGHEVISVVLHTDKPGIWDDSKALLSYGLIKLGCPAEAIVDTTDRTEEPASSDEGH
ncbi:MAG TPA: D-alanyl-D-alanine carboxypeptidase family protein [Chthoniobacterales bacterium]|jgi:serine-type D-Ala-D-Ala carboxypeptidase (penicillin-binding protein 5/6)|nr:D-alanyl-D-alanine carboxypeptidase family protein [Chthoniobacterales bacterium]